MTAASDSWWNFTADLNARAPVDAAHIDAKAKTEGPHDVLDYHTYLKLDELFSAQVPSSDVPDERAFIITHQLFELTFKMMLFDFAVITRSLTSILENTSAKEFEAISCSSSARYADHWGAAIISAGRIQKCASEVIPVLTSMLYSTQTFSTTEFYAFRPHLGAGSGFQSAQYRLLQRALGKAHLLGIRIFPSEAFLQAYGGDADDGLVTVVDDLVLHARKIIADPPTNSHFAEVALADDIAHKALARLPGPRPANGEDSVPRIGADTVQDTIRRFKVMLSDLREEQDLSARALKQAETKDRVAVEVFSRDLRLAARLENARRRGMTKARRGAVYLREYIEPNSYLRNILDRIVTADDALFGSGRSFARSHHELAGRHLRHGSASGTGGGGLMYLTFVRTAINPMFKALTAYRVEDEYAQEEYTEA